MKLEELIQFATENNEPEWFVEKRKAAFNKMSNLPLPSIQRFDFHNWKMTPETTDILKTNISGTDQYVLTDIFDAARIIQN
jgi:ABC-type transport system involved in Fe-S cluster assembly, permease component